SLGTRGGRQRAVPSECVGRRVRSLQVQGATGDLPTVTRTAEATTRVRDDRAQVEGDRTDGAVDDGDGPPRGGGGVRNTRGFDAPGPVRTPHPGWRHRARPAPRRAAVALRRRARAVASRGPAAPARRPARSGVAAVPA